MNDTRAFYPLYQNSNEPLSQIGQNLVSTTVAAVNATAVASAAFQGGNGANNNYFQIQIANKTSVWVHVNFGILLGGQTVRAATINDYPVAPGGVVVVSVPEEVNAASVYADGAPASSTSVVFTRGEGL